MRIVSEAVFKEHKADLEVQLKEAYGKITYTYTAHNKLMNRLEKRYRLIKIVQIVLSAVSTYGFIKSLVTNDAIATWIGGIFAAVLLAMNLYFKEFNLSEKIAQHGKAADALWLLREQYISLLTDLTVLPEDEIMLRRDDLQNRTSEVYKQSPKTDAKSYLDAQNALKNDEEQFFAIGELNKMLPSYLRGGSDTDG